MKYFDENDVEIPEEEINLELGYIIPEQKIKKHHEAIEPTEEKNHYEVGTFYFEDGTSLTVESQDDPHIKPIDPENGVFEYIDQGEGKELRGIDLKTVVDEEAVEGKEAWDEYEDFYRYIPYTEDEIKARKEEEERQRKQSEFLAEGPDKLENLTSTLGETNKGLTQARDDINTLGVDVGDLSVTLVEIMESL